MKRATQEALRQWGAGLTGQPSEVQFAELTRIVRQAVGDVPAVQQFAITGLPDNVYQDAAELWAELIGELDPPEELYEQAFLRCFRQVVATVLKQSQGNNRLWLVIGADVSHEGDSEWEDSAWPTELEAQMRAKYLGPTAYVTVRNK